MNRTIDVSILRGNGSYFMRWEARPNDLDTQVCRGQYVAKSDVLRGVFLEILEGNISSYVYLNGFGNEDEGVEELRNLELEHNRRLENLLKRFLVKKGEVLK